LRGSFPLDEQTINEQVNPGYPGVYALGYLREKTFLIQSIGRSDTNINAQLKEHVGKYDRFKFSLSASPEDTFIKECELYHSFTGTKDKIPHPGKPQGSSRGCPLCSSLGSQTDT